MSFTYDNLRLMHQVVLQCACLAHTTYSFVVPWCNNHQDKGNKHLHFQEIQYNLGHML